MDRRQFLTFAAALPAVSVLLQACGGDDADPSPVSTAPGPDPTEGDPGGAQAIRSQVARAEVDPALAAAAAAAINTFGANVEAALVDADPAANLVFSPASILLALAMTAAGAAGTTAEEMNSVLGIRDPAEFYPACNALDAALGTVSGPVEDAEGERVELALEIANSLWAQSGLPFEEAFLDLLARDFGAGLETVDYRRDPEAARRLINAWVDEHTAGRIPELLPAGTISRASRLTLVNTVYLKAPWETPFEKRSTEPTPFTRADGGEVEVQMMNDSRYAGYLADDAWQVAELPYAGDRLAMVLARPTDDAAPLDTTGFTWPPSAALGSTKVRLSIPRWDVATSASLADILRTLGMPSAFDAETADFSGMTTAEQLVIAAVIHQANITVDEYGTEAAAATAVVLEATAAPGPNALPPELVLDRPFLFAVRDIETGAILFQGRVNDPTA